jgi:hypothetical protein
LESLISLRADESEGRGGVDANAVGILQGLVGLDWIDVAFLIDSGGRLLASIGSSPAFSAAGEFRDAATQVTGDPDTSVYMTAITQDVYLGVLFDSEVRIEDVRTRVKAAEGALAAAITPG